jgi:hypothetical protein
MSETSQPIQVLDVFNKQNFHTGLASEFVKFPKAQSTVTMPNGVKFGDGSFQNSASTGSSLTIQDASPGTDSVSNVSLITITDGILTAGAAGEAILSITGSGATPTLDDVLTASSNITTETIIIEEATGTYGSSSGGTITLKHNDTNGANSIVFKNNDAAGNYAAINYIDNIEGLTSTSPFDQFSEYTILQSGGSQTNSSILALMTDINPSQSSASGGDSMVIRPSANLILDTGSSSKSRSDSSLIIVNPTGATAGSLIVGKQSRNTVSNKLEVSGDSRFEGTIVGTGTIEGGTLTDGTATLTGGALTGLTSVTSTTLAGEIQTKTTYGTTPSISGSTLTLTTAGNTYETFDYEYSGAADTVSTFTFSGTQRNNSQYVVCIYNNGSGDLSFPTTISGVKVNHTSQVVVTYPAYAILTIYYKDSSTIFASVSVFS